MASGRRNRYGRAGGGASKIVSEINVTPLVDVSLVLLIIFMVVTPILGEPVDLPETKNHKVDNDDDQPVVIIDKTGKVYCSAETDTLGEASKPETLQRMTDCVAQMWDVGEREAQGTYQKRVSLKADKGVPYKFVQPVMFALDEMKPPQVELGTNELEDAN